MEMNFGKANPNKCCEIRKVLPLNEVLSAATAWISGLRREQSESRENIRNLLIRIIVLNPLKFVRLFIGAGKICGVIQIKMNLIIIHCMTMDIQALAVKPCTAPAINADDLRSGRWTGTRKQNVVYMIRTAWCLYISGLDLGGVGTELEDRGIKYDNNLLGRFVALFFAMNIGASGAAAAVSVAYGSGAIQTRKRALLLCAIAIFLGAVIGGGEVAETIGTGIIPQSIMTAKVVLIILSLRPFHYLSRTMLGIPLSTSEITVGAMVGVGIAQQALYINNILVIVSFWFIVPILGFGLAFIFGKVITKLNHKYPQLQKKKAQKILTIFVIIIGFFEAFSAGMNNVGNAVGPLIGANLISVTTGTVVGGIFIAAGVMFLGGRVLQTNAKKITKFSLLEGGTISSIGRYFSYNCFHFWSYRSHLHK